METTLKSRVRTTLGERVFCSLEVLTPVHVGSGVRLKAGFDFDTTTETTTIVSQADLYAYFRSRPEEGRAFADNPRLSTLKRMPGGLRYPVKAEANDLLEFVRDGNGRPYLPGSSIKGALRTALLRERVQSFKVEQAIGNVKFAEKDILKSVFGPDPYQNLMRALAPGDAAAHEGMLTLRRVLILNLTDANGESAGWKNVPDRNTSSDPDKGTAIFAEMLGPGAVVPFSLYRDDFVFSDRARELNLQTKRFSMEDLAVLANRCARKRLASEFDFIDRIQNLKDVDNILDDIERLRNLIPVEKSDQEKQVFMLRMGWGSGWRSMTGDYLTENQLSIIRNQNPLGKKGMPFPKTRKIVFDEDEPVYLPGWVLVRLDRTPESQEQRVPGGAERITIFAELDRVVPDSEQRGQSNPEGVTEIIEDPINEPGEPAMLKQIGKRTTGAPARIVGRKDRWLTVELHVVGYEGKPIPMIGRYDADGYENKEWVLVDVDKVDKKGHVIEVRYNKRMPQ